MMRLATSLFLLPPPISFEGLDLHLQHRTIYLGIVYEGPMGLEEEIYCIRRK